MDGYEADLDAITAAAGVLRSTVDTVATAADHLDVDVCARLGPGRLGAVAAGLTEDAKRDLDRVLGTIVEDAELAHAGRAEYADRDGAAADLLRRVNRDQAG